MIHQVKCEGNGKGDMLRSASYAKFVDYMKKLLKIIGFSVLGIFVLFVVGMIFIAIFVPEVIPLYFPVLFGIL